MFIIHLNYKKPLDVVDQHVDAHRKFILDNVNKGLFLMAGPKEPRTGGIIVARGEDEAQLWALLKQDPFYTADIAEFVVVKFAAVRFHPSLADMV